MLELAVNLAVLGAVVSAIILGWKLNKQLLAFRRNKDGLTDMLARIEAAASTAHKNVSVLKEIMENSSGSLNFLVDNGEKLSAELSFLISTAEKLSERLEKKVIASRQVALDNDLAKNMVTNNEVSQDERRKQLFNRRKRMRRNLKIPTNHP